MPKNFYKNARLQAYEKSQLFSSQSIQFGPAMIYKMFISAQRVTWIILIENLEENYIREFLPKCKAIGLRKISAFFLSKHSVWPCNDLQNVHLCPKGDVNHINWKCRGKMYPRFLPKSKAIGLRKISIFTVNFSPLKAFSLVLQWFTKCSSLPKRWRESY